MIVRPRNVSSMNTVLVTRMKECSAVCSNVVCPSLSCCLRGFYNFFGVFMVVKLAPKPHNPANKWQWPILINNKWWWRNVPPSTPMLFARLYLAAWGGDGPRRAYLARKPMMTTLMIVQVFISNSLGHHIVRINFRTCLQTGQKTESSCVECFSSDVIRQT